MLRKWTIEERPLLMLANLAIREDEKETKKLSIVKAEEQKGSVTSCSFISKGLMQFWNTKKRSATGQKKGVKNSSHDDEEKGVQKETSFKIIFDHEKEEWVVHKKQKRSIMEEGEDIAEKGSRTRLLNLDQTGPEKTQSSEKKVPRICNNDFVPENNKRKYTNNGDNVIKRRKQGSNALDGPNPPPELPEEFKKKISELAGGNIISHENLAVQKKLEDSDCNGGQNRFSIPKGILSKPFLEDDEKGEKYHMVHIIDPSLKHYKIKLSLWKPFYALNGDNWKVIKKENDLQPGMIMQLWSFRVNNELWFALVNLTSPIENVGMEEAEKGSVIMEEAVRPVDHLNNLS